MENIFLEMEKSLFKKSFCSNIENLERILDENFFEYGKSGAIISRNETICFLSESDDRNIAITNFTVDKISDNTWIIHYVSKDENNISSLRTSIWIYKDNQYKMYFHQGTKDYNSQN